MIRKNKKVFAHKKNVNYGFDVEVEDECPVTLQEMMKQNWTVYNLSLYCSLSSFPMRVHREISLTFECFITPFRAENHSTNS